jgi:hypothetical protein
MGDGIDRSLSRRLKRETERVKPCREADLNVPHKYAINPSRSRFAPYALGLMTEHGLPGSTRARPAQGIARTLVVQETLEDLECSFSRAAVIRLGDEPAAARSALGVLHAHG